jgi:hypothetical protein
MPPIRRSGRQQNRELPPSPARQPDEIETIDVELDGFSTGRTVNRPSMPESIEGRVIFTSDPRTVSTVKNVPVNAFEIKQTNDGVYIVELLITMAHFARLRHDLVLDSSWNMSLNGGNISGECFLHSHETAYHPLPPNYIGGSRRGRPMGVRLRLFNRSGLTVTQTAAATAPPQSRTSTPGSNIARLQAIAEQIELAPDNTQPQSGPPSTRAMEPNVRRFRLDFE